MNSRPESRSGEKKMDLKKLSVLSLTFLTISLMCILMCVALLFGEDCEGNSSSESSPGEVVSQKKF